MNDIRRTILWVIFGFSMVLLWDKWQIHNGQKGTFLLGTKPPVTATAPAAAPASSGPAPTGVPSSAGVPPSTVPPAAHSWPNALSKRAKSDWDSYEWRMEDRIRSAEPWLAGCWIAMLVSV